MSDEKVYEMQWDCKFCGTTKLLGKTHRFCPNCGAAQDPETRYYPSDEEKVAVQDHKFVGADLICGSCSTPNSGNAEFCMQCGAPLTNAARAKTLGSQTARAGESFASSGPRDVAQEHLQEDLAAAKARESKGGRSRIAAVAIIGVVLAIIAGVIYALTATRQSSVLVTGHSWEHVIHVSELQAVSENAWCDSLPGDAYSVTRRQEQRGERQIPDGEECHTVRQDNGDGTFSEREQCETRYRSEPVYDDKCYFTVDRWQQTRNVMSSGASLADAPYWADANITRAGNCLGCEREESRETHYVVHLREGDNTYDCDVPYERWQEMRVETRWQLEIRRVGGLPQCDSLQPAA